MKCSKSVYLGLTASSKHVKMIIKIQILGFTAAAVTKILIKMIILTFRVLMHAALQLSRVRCDFRLKLYIFDYFCRILSPFLAIYKIFELIRLLFQLKLA